MRLGKVRPFEIKGKQRVVNDQSWPMVIYLPSGVTVYLGEGVPPTTPPMVVLRPGDAVILEGTGSGVIVGWPD